MGRWPSSEGFSLWGAGLAVRASAYGGTGLGVRASAFEALAYQ